MEWFVFAILSPILIAISNVVDKFMFNKYIKNPYSFQVILALTFIPVLLTFLLLLRPTFNIFSLMSFSFGAFLTFVYILYNKAMIKEEASRVVALLYLQPVFVLVFAFLILGEIVSFLSIAGIFFLILSAVIVSYKKVRKKFSLFSYSAKVILIFDILLSLAMIGAKWILGFISSYEFVFWGLLGVRLDIYFCCRFQFERNSLTI